MTTQTVLSENTKGNYSTWDFGEQIDWSAIKPKFKNLKEEVLENKFAKISKRKWNDILLKSEAILNFHIGSTDRIKFSHILKRNNIKLKNILALKLYCDADNLQSEFRKCFISKYKNDIEHNDRVSSFYHWRKELNSTFNKLSKIKFNKNKNNKTQILYHGVTCQSIINQQNGIFYGPLSTTRDISVAREFAGNNGMILVIDPHVNSMYNLLNLSLISDHPQEQEILLLNHNINIKSYVYSNEFDTINYSYYKPCFDKDMNTDNHPNYVPVEGLNKTKSFVMHTQTVPKLLNYGLSNYNDNPFKSKVEKQIECSFQANLIHNFPISLPKQNDYEYFNNVCLNVLKKAYVQKSGYNHNNKLFILRIGHTNNYKTKRNESMEYGRGYTGKDAYDEYVLTSTLWEMKRLIFLFLITKTLTQYKTIEYLM